MELQKTVGLSAVLALLAGGTGQVLAANFYVGGDGASDRNPGTASQPFATIQKAASVAAAGDFVNIRPGIYRETVVPASSGNKQQAISWTTAMRPTGATNLGDAILLAFEDKEVDTIFVLSDGQPNQGKLPSADAILNEVRRINTARRIVIHTINFAGARDFMKKLAEENGGQFVDY